MHFNGDWRLDTAAFNEVFHHGKKLHHSLVTVRYYCHPALNGAAVRTAVAVPKKLAAASERNRWKRQMRHQFYALVRQLPESTALLEAGQQCDLIFMLTTRGVAASRQQVRRAMSQLWKQIPL